MQDFSICFFKTILDFSRETGKILPTNSEMFQSPENSANTYQGKFTRVFNSSTVKVANENNMEIFKNLSWVWSFSM